MARKVEEIRWSKLLEEAGVPKANDIFTYTSTQELRALYALASCQSQEATALEIGSHLGASSCYIAAGLKKLNGRLLCVDTWNNETMPEQEQNTFAQFTSNVEGVKQQIIPIRKRSEDISEEDIETDLNFVFIDGDHSYEAVKRDFEYVQKWLAKDATVAFHDFASSYFEGVTRVVGEALGSGKWIMAGCVGTLVWIKPAHWIDPDWLD